MTESNNCFIMNAKRHHLIHRYLKIEAVKPSRPVGNPNFLMANFTCPLPLVKKENVHASADLLYNKYYRTDDSPVDLQEYRRVWFEIAAPNAKVVLLSVCFKAHPLLF